MDINNDYYVIAVAIIAVLMMGLVVYASQQRLLRNGRSQSQAATISAILSALVGVIVVGIGLKLPLGVAVFTLVIAVIWGAIYFNVLVFLRNKIHKAK